MSPVHNYYVNHGTCMETTITHTEYLMYRIYFTYNPNTNMSVKKNKFFSCPEPYDQTRPAVILFVTDHEPAEYHNASSLFEKEAMNTQVGLILDKLEFQWSF